MSVDKTLPARVENCCVLSSSLQPHHILTNAGPRQRTAAPFPNTESKISFDKGLFARRKVVAKRSHRLQDYESDNDVGLFPEVPIKIIGTVINFLGQERQQPFPNLPPKVLRHLPIGVIDESTPAAKLGSKTRHHIAVLTIQNYVRRREENEQRRQKLLQLRQRLLRIRLTEAVSL